MLKYIFAHWRGEQSLARSCLINGGVFGVVTYALTMIVQIGLAFLILTPIGRNMSLMGWLIYVFWPFRILVPLVWAVWACVGIFRCAFREIRERSKARTGKLGAAAAMVVAIALAVWVGHEGIDFVRTEKDAAPLVAISDACMKESNYQRSLGECPEWQRATAEWTTPGK
jgi:hypothetical protein